MHPLGAVFRIFYEERMTQFLSIPLSDPHVVKTSRAELFAQSGASLCSFITGPRSYCGGEREFGEASISLLEMLIVHLCGLHPFIPHNRTEPHNAIVRFQAATCWNGLQGLNLLSQAKAETFLRLRDCFDTRMAIPIQFPNPPTPILNNNENRKYKIRFASFS